MPAGIEAVVEDGFATIDFVDRSLLGPALEALRQAGSKVTKETRVGPRARYTMPEGDAIAAGLIDGATGTGPLAYGDTGYAKALQDVGNAAGEDWARPEAPTSRNTYVGQTPAADVMAIKGPSTTVSGSKPDNIIVTPIHGSVKKYGDYSLPQPHEPGDCTHPGDGSGVASDGVIDYVEPTTIHSKAPKRPTTTVGITMDKPGDQSQDIVKDPVNRPTGGGDGGSVLPPAPEPVAPDTQPAPAAPGADATVAELKAYAEANNIDLNGATKKADILAAIEASS